MATGIWDYLTTPAPDHPGGFSGGLFGPPRSAGLLGQPTPGLLGGAPGQDAVPAAPSPLARMFPRMAQAHQSAMTDRIPFRENPVITEVGAALLNGPGMNGRYDFTGVSRGMAAARGMKDKRAAQQEEQTRRRLASAALKRRSGVDLKPEEVELLALYPDAAAKYIGDTAFAGNNPGTTDMQNYRFYAGEELKTGGTPIPFREWVSSNSGRGTQTGTERIASALMEEAATRGETISFSEALSRAQRAPTEERDLVTRERLASEAARADQSNYIGDPEGTLRRWREFYGLPDAVPNLKKPERDARPTTAPLPSRPKDKVSITKPQSIPGNAAFSAELGVWFGDDGQFYDKAGTPIPPPVSLQ